jgi:YgiT-type zinc finger domain-containing protein
MNCLICRQAEIVEGFTSVKFERGEMRRVITRVPAHICPSCGEAYVDEEVAVKLLSDAEEMSAMGVMDSVVEYTAA